MRPEDEDEDENASSTAFLNGDSPNPGKDDGGNPMKKAKTNGKAPLA